jgi:hypothetical protein
MRIKLGVFSLLAVAVPLAGIGPHDLSWLGWLLTGVLLTGALGFSAMLSRTPPSTSAGKFLAYVLAVTATQAYPIMDALATLMDTGPSGPPSVSTAKDVLLDLAAGGLSLWAFFLVRGWTSRRHVGEHPPSGERRRSWVTRYSEGSLAAFVVSMVSTVAVVPRDFILSLSTATLNPDMHLDSGSTADWIGEMCGGAVAGVEEEPVYIGVAVLLFPDAHKSWRSFAPVAAVTSFARTLLHVYYASGQQNLVAGVAAVFVWCAIWSTTGLALLYWTRSLVPIIVGHGLHNTMITDSSHKWTREGPWAATIEITQLVVFLGVVAGLVALLVLQFRNSIIEIRRRKREKELASG